MPRPNVRTQSPHTLPDQQWFGPVSRFACDDTRALKVLTASLPHALNFAHHIFDCAPPSGTSQGRPATDKIAVSPPRAYPNCIGRYVEAPVSSYCAVHQLKCRMNFRCVRQVTLSRRTPSQAWLLPDPDRVCQVSTHPPPNGIHQVRGSVRHRRCRMTSSLV